MNEKVGGTTSLRVFAVDIDVVDSDIRYAPSEAHAMVAVGSAQIAHQNSRVRSVRPRLGARGGPLA